MYCHESDKRTVSPHRFPLLRSGSVTSRSVTPKSSRPTTPNTSRPTTPNLSLAGRRVSSKTPPHLLLELNYVAWTACLVTLIGNYRTLNNMEEVCCTFSLIKLPAKENQFGLLLENISSIKISKTVPGFCNVKGKKRHLVSVFQRWNSENFVDYTFSVFSKII